MKGLLSAIKFRGRQVCPIDSRAPGLSFSPIALFVLGDDFSRGITTQAQLFALEVRGRQVRPIDRRAHAARLGLASTETTSGGSAVAVTDGSQLGPGWSPKIFKLTP